MAVRAADPVGEGTWQERGEHAARERRERRQAQQVRGGVQLFCLVLTVLLVWQYHRFISAILAEAPRLPPRPDGAEAFLPIAAVVSLFHLVKTGEYDPIHPAALTILLAAILVSLLARKAFCAWVCPVGAFRVAGQSGALLGPHLPPAPVARPPAPRRQSSFPPSSSSASRAPATLLLPLRPLCRRGDVGYWFGAASGR